MTTDDTEQGKDRSKRAKRRQADRQKRERREERHYGRINERDLSYRAGRFGLENDTSYE